MTSREMVIAGYIAFIAIGVLMWFIFRAPNSPVSTVSALIDRIMHHRTTRLAIMLAWWWVGWHFLVNVVHR
ncbi:MAG: hypothetical protein F2590_04675 [Actinobacteria bacterium]|uniref:Unannotated protein n=1 Tax=freshwater metagenome TaxID=449393 RepID=A0A6J6HX73_9ZZZZ|nr:hypothetical protein [Actinomycetota bacterium]